MFVVGSLRCLGNLSDRGHVGGGVGRLRFVASGLAVGSTDAGSG